MSGVTGMSARQASDSVRDECSPASGTVTTPGRWYSATRGTIEMSRPRRPSHGRGRCRRSHRRDDPRFDGGRERVDHRPGPVAAPQEDDWLRSEIGANSGSPASGWSRGSTASSRCVRCASRASWGGDVSSEIKAASWRPSSISSVLDCSRRSSTPAISAENAANGSGTGRGPNVRRNPKRIASWPIGLERPGSACAAASEASAASAAADGRPPSSVRTARRPSRETDGSRAWSARALSAD